MLIDWFTVCAQALNFLILVWLLKHLLYKPILNALDAREKLIASKLSDADAKEAVARKDRDEFQHKTEELERQRASLLSKAVDEAKAERQRLLDEARKDADSLRAKREEALRTEQRNLSQDIIRWTQKEVFAITRKTLSDLAGASLEERMGEVFIQRIRALTGTAKEKLAAALGASTQQVKIYSAFDLPAIQRAEIQKALNETFSADIHIQFDTVPELVSGIALSTNEQKVSWSIADYLARLEKSASELLNKAEKSEHEAEVKPEPKAEAKPAPKPETKPASKPVLEPASSASKGS